MSGCAGRWRLRTCRCGRRWRYQRRPAHRVVASGARPAASGLRRGRLLGPAIGFAVRFESIFKSVLRSGLKSVCNPFQDRVCGHSAIRFRKCWMDPINRFWQPRRGEANGARCDSPPLLPRMRCRSSAGSPGCGALVRSGSVPRPARIRAAAWAVAQRSTLRFGRAGPAISPARPCCPRGPDRPAGLHSCPVDAAARRPSPRPDSPADRRTGCGQSLAQRSGPPPVRVRQGSNKLPMNQKTGGGS
jgi:hypothetical protein